MIDGIYDRGNTQTNLEEAKAVAKAVMEHAKRAPKHSLGVGAFSIKQGQAILNELEELRRNSSELEEFFNPAKTEPFFVKNLETIQGHERDIIFISIGYGKDKDKYMSMNLSPLNKEGGQRRLNVLITRSRIRCEVFSSITADDIDLSRSQTKGVSLLKSFLHFAQSGNFLSVPEHTQRGFGSPFEEAVANGLFSLGYVVESQVGVSGFFIDLAIVDPVNPTEYLLAIECDGAAYHSSLSARDRDILRQEILEDHGWIIHRVWSLDWFLNPQRELEKIRRRVEDINSKVDVKVEEAPKPQPESSLEQTPQIFYNRPFTTVPNLASKTIPYKEAFFQVDSSRAPHQMGFYELAQILTNIVEAEGPIHGEEIGRRVATLCGLQKAGSRIQHSVAHAISNLESKEKLLSEENFYTLPNQQIEVRDRTDVKSYTLRKPKMLPPQEIRKGILEIVRNHFGAKEDEIITQLSRMVGFQSTRTLLKAIIQKQIFYLVHHSEINLNGDILEIGVSI